MSNTRCPPKGTAPPCACGCGQQTIWHGSRNHWARFVNGHQNTGRRSTLRIERGAAPPCQCGCGEPVKTFRYAGKGWARFVVGHQPRRAHTPEAIEKMSRAAQSRSEQVSKANRLRVWTAESRKRTSDSHKAVGATLSEKVSGERNGSWRGGLPNRHRTRIALNSYQLGKITARIRQRDGNKCVLCGATRTSHRNLPVHHVTDDMSNHSDRNLVTLCEQCHMAVEFGANEGPRLRVAEYMAQFA